MFIQWEEAGSVDLYYFDETGFSLTPCVPYAWQPKGRTLEIISTRSQRINVLGFMNRQGKGMFHSVTGSVTSEVVIASIDKFALKHEKSCCGSIKPCIVILDNASMHRSQSFKAKIKDWAAMGVILHFLPPYSPELNLIEILWKQIKYYWLPLDAYQSFEKLKYEVTQVLDSIGEKYCITFA